MRCPSCSSCAWWWEILHPAAVDSGTGSGSGSSRSGREWIERPSDPGGILRLGQKHSLRMTSWCAFATPSWCLCSSCFEHLLHGPPPSTRQSERPHAGRANFQMRCSANPPRFRVSAISLCVTASITDPWSSGVQAPSGGHRHLGMRDQRESAFIRGPFEKRTAARTAGATRG